MTAMENEPTGSNDSTVTDYAPTAEEVRITSDEFLVRSVAASDIVEVTPWVAGRWLERNMHNRTLNEGAVKKYVEDICADDWKLQGDAFRFDRDGELIDGQHRCHAVVAAGRSVSSYVAVGLDPEVRDYLDAGKARTVADVLTINGVSGTLARKLAAAGQFAVEWAASGHVRSGNNHPRSAYLDFITANRVELLEAITATQTTAREITFPAPTLAAFYLFASHGRLSGVAGVPLGPDVELPDADQFVIGVREGAGLEADDPILVWRNWYIRMKSATTPPPAPVLAAALVDTWNIWVQGLPTARVKVPKVSGPNQAWPVMMTAGAVAPEVAS